MVDTELRLLWGFRRWHFPECGIQPHSGPTRCQRQRWRRRLPTP